jgi:hypothetical protein
MLYKHSTRSAANPHQQAPLLANEVRLPAATGPCANKPPTWLLGHLGQPLLLRQHVDEGGLAHVGTANDSKLGVTLRRAAPQVYAAADVLRGTYPRELRSWQV